MIASCHCPLPLFDLMFLNTVTRLPWANMCFKFHPIATPDMSGSRDFLCLCLLYQGKHSHKGQCPYKRTTEARSNYRCCQRKKKCYILWECVSVALVIQHAMRMHICGLSGSTTLFHIISYLGKWYWIYKVFWFSLQHMSETFLIPKKFSEIQLKMCTGIHVKYQPFLSDFNKTYVFLTDFRNIYQYKISQKSV